MGRMEDALRRAAGLAVGHGGDHATVAARDGARIEDYSEEPGQATAPVLARHRRAEPDRPSGRAATATTPAPMHLSARADGKVVSVAGTSVASVEQYRRLATTLHGLQRQRGVKSLMVTSSVIGEGKTLTSTNLALTFSESYGQRVLLIDADLRRPSLHELLGLPNDAGLSDVLRTPGSPLPLLQVTERLAVLPGGPLDGNPVAGLASRRLRDLLQEAAARYEWVILDTPPVGMISDAKLMAGLVDGVVFVIGAGSTGWQPAERAIAEIGRDRILGAVLNRVDQSETIPADYYRHSQQAAARPSHEP